MVSTSTSKVESLSSNLSTPAINLTPIVKKQNKRLYIIIVETGEKYYTPPDFIRHKMHSREKLVATAHRMMYIPYKDWFDEIMKFEYEMHRGRLV